MKKQLYLLFFPLLILVVGCSDSDDDKQITVPITEYVLNNETCSWEDIENIESIEGVVYFHLNKRDDLDGLITCESGTYPEVDFEKYTLLFVLGVKPHLAYDVKCELKKYAKVDAYSLYVEMHELNEVHPTIPTIFIKAFLAPKIPQGASWGSPQVTLHPYKNK